MGIQDIPGFRIIRCVIRIPGTGFWTLSQWNLESGLLLVGSGLLDLDYTLWIQDSRYLVSGTWNLGLQLLVGSRFLDLYSRFQCPGFLIIHRAFRIPGTGV